MLIFGVCGCSLLLTMSVCESGSIGVEIRYASVCYLFSERCWHFDAWVGAVVAYKKCVGDDVWWLCDIWNIFCILLIRYAVCFLCVSFGESSLITFSRLYILLTILESTVDLWGPMSSKSLLSFCREPSLSVLHKAPLCLHQTSHHAWPSQYFLLQISHTPPRGGLSDVLSCRNSSLPQFLYLNSSPSAALQAPI